MITVIYVINMLRPLNIFLFNVIKYKKPSRILKKFLKIKLILNLIFRAVYTGFIPTILPKLK